MLSNQSPTTFERFLDGFIQECGYYIPIDTSDNNYRHFGCKKDKKLYLSHTELLYLFSHELSEEADLETRMYFDLKNAGANILQRELNGIQYVYRKTKHFNRDKDNHIGILELKKRDDKFVYEMESKVIAIKGENTVCFIETNPIEDLNFILNANLYKTGNQKI